MNIVVIGAGAVGGYFGGKMAKAGIPVTFLVREKRYRQLEKRGLRIQSVHGDFTIQPHCVQTPEEVDHPELVILAVKNYHLDALDPVLKSFEQRGAKILPLLNGVRHIEHLTTLLGSKNILGGVCYIESTLNEEGDILQKSTMQDIVFGPLAETDTSFLNELKELFEKSGISVKLSPEILTEMWSKYIFLVSLSGMTTATRSPIGVTLKDPVATAFLNNFIVEVVTVAQSLKINLPENFAEQTLARIKALNPEMTSSMHRDLEKGLPLELDSLHGALLDMARQCQIDTPCIRAIYSLVHPFI